MRHRLLLIVSIFFIAQNLSSQTQERIDRGRTQFRKIIELVRHDDIRQLAELIEYPLIRPDPIPNIETKESFILYYPTLFDDRFKEMLLDTTRSLSDVFVDPHSFFVGLFRGEIYVNDDGLINRINYNSIKETELKNTLNKETLSLMHPSIKKWKENIIVCKSENFLIRIDLMEDNTLRYISWSSPKTIRDKPDLILLGGNEEVHGEMGGEAFSFKNGDWIYMIDEVSMCEDDSKCGIFLRLIQKDEEKQTIRMNRIK
jgi:hypothetical protein